MIEAEAVSAVAAHGQSVALRRKDRKRGRSPSSASCDSVRDAPAKGCSVPWNMLNTMNQIAAPLPKLPSTGAKVGPRTGSEVQSQRLGTEDAEPNNWQDDEIDAGHRG
jgi:hypothetical protein